MGAWSTGLSEKRSAASEDPPGREPCLAVSGMWSSGDRCRIGLHLSTLT